MCLDVNHTEFAAFLYGPMPEEEEGDAEQG